MESDCQCIGHLLHQVVHLPFQQLFWHLCMHSGSFNSTIRFLSFLGILVLVWVTMLIFVLGNSYLFICDFMASLILFLMDIVDRLDDAEQAEMLMDTDYHPAMAIAAGYQPPTVEDDPEETEDVASPNNIETPNSIPDGNDSGLVKPRSEVPRGTSALEGIPPYPRDRHFSFRLGKSRLGTEPGDRIGAQKLRRGRPGA